MDLIVAAGQLLGGLRLLQRLSNDMFVPWDLQRLGKIRSRIPTRLAEYDDGQAIAGLEQQLHIQRHSMLSDGTVDAAAIANMLRHWEEGGMQYSGYVGTSAQQHRQGKVVHYFDGVHLMTGAGGSRERLVLYHLGHAQFVAVYYCDGSPDAVDTYNNILNKMEGRWYAHKASEDAGLEAIADVEVAEVQLVAGLIG